MREIVATIQAEQDFVIRAPMEQVLIVQGGPGTGKTAVALHRAAYLLFEHRRRLARDGVLVIGPNRAFLDYIGNVLPSLGERSVRQTTVLDLCVPKVEITGVDDPAAARAKGDAVMLEELRAGGDARRQAADGRRRRPARRAPARVHGRRDRRVARPRHGRRGAVQPAPAAAALDRPAGAAPANRRRRVGAGRAAAQGARRGVADAAADPPRRQAAARRRGASAGRGRLPTSCSSTRPTRSSTARRWCTATSWSTRLRTTRRSPCG